MAVAVPVDAEFTYQRQRNRGEAAKGDTLSETRRLYLHLYLNRERVERMKRLATDLMSLKNDIEKRPVMSSVNQLRRRQKNI